MGGLEKWEQWPRQEICLLGHFDGKPWRRACEDQQRAEQQQSLSTKNTYVEAPD